MCSRKLGFLALLLMLGSAHAAETPAAGVYKLEKTHASLIWRVSHMGLSQYTARFTDFDVSLDFYPDQPEQSLVTASINPLSVRTDHPTNAEKWEHDLAHSPKWFNADKFPKISFVSISASKTGKNSGKLTGNLTLLGVTRAVTLDVIYNGSARFPWMGELDVIGFSARTVILRSEFGMNTLLPGIGDEVEIIIEAEFVKGA